MSLAASLTNDLEQAIKTYRVPVLTAIALSLRDFAEDRFLTTDPQTEDPLRNIAFLDGVSKIERLMTAAELGVDGNQFQDLSGCLLFTGQANAAGLPVPLPSTGIVGGAFDPNGVGWTSSSFEPLSGPQPVDSQLVITNKESKLKRYDNRRPNDVTWRIRTPIMEADSTQVIDYLAFRCNKLQYLHSIAIKWSAQRWDGRSVSIHTDLYRPLGEMSDMIILAPMWMDENMDMLDPNIWGPYESIIQANYAEYMSGNLAQYAADLAAFITTYQQYIMLLAPDKVCASTPDQNRLMVGRLERRLRTTFSQTLHIPFSASFDPNTQQWQNEAYDPADSKQVTADLFNFQGLTDALTMTSSFESATPAIDGWYGTAMASMVTDIPANLPPYATLRDGTQVTGTQAMRLSNGFMARRLLMPDGQFAISFWLKTTGGRARVEIIQNTRLHDKKVNLDVATSQVQSIQHFRESYETIASSVFDIVQGTWQSYFLSFKLQDRYFVSGQSYPSHELYVVVSNVDTGAIITIDQMDVWLNTDQFDVQLINTQSNSPFPNLLLPSELLISMESVFSEDTVYATYEKAAIATHLDGTNLIVQVPHRDSYNLHPTGTSINGWFKLNSVDASGKDVTQQLNDVGAFTLFEKGAGGSYLPSYNCAVNSDKVLVMTFGSDGAASSTGFYNVLLHPSMGSVIAPPVFSWFDQPYARYQQCFSATSQQPREYLPNLGQLFGTPTGPNPVNTPLGDGRIITISSDDPYLSVGRYVMSDPAPSGFITGWMYLEWHARQAYSAVTGAPIICPDTMTFSMQTATGFVFATIPLAIELFNIPANFGQYNPSPGEWRPNAGYSPLPWPISPCEYGTATWPYSPHEGPVPTFVPFTWAQIGFDPPLIFVPTALFLAGVLTFDRWLNLGISASSTAISVYTNGLLVSQSGGSSFNVGDGSEPNADLLIGASAASTTNVGAPLSVFSFKIFQTALTTPAQQAIFKTEGVNFNEYQYEIFAQYFDFDLNGQLDWYQDELTDYGLGTNWVDAPPPYGQPFNGPFPASLQKQYGQVRVLKADPIQLPTILSHDYTVLDDWLDAPYLAELIEAQTVGLSDALIWWDFLTDQQASVHDFVTTQWNATTCAYEPVTLSYKQWVLDQISAEWNSVLGITDPLPTIASLTNSPSPVDPNYGSNDNQLFETGVKGWFGFDGLLGYRDSIARCLAEGIIFDYLQIEFRFRVDRAALEAHLVPYAHSYQDILLNNYEGNQLTNLS